VSRILVTGGAGFIGSQLVRDLVSSGWQVVVLDQLTYAGRRENLEGVACELVVGNVCDARVVSSVMDGCEAVLHAAAESHVERSLADPGVFVRTNVEGTRVVLHEAATHGISRFVHVSTDEVFGAAPEGVRFAPQDPLVPGNPYAASKAGAEALVHAWRHSYGFPASVVRCTNNYGPRQHPEKAVPSWMLAALSGGPVPVHGEGTAVRDWLYVGDLSMGVVAAVEHWRPAATWHFAGRRHMANRVLAGRIAGMVGDLPLTFGPERQGQDARYALDDEQTRQELGWAPRVSLQQGLETTLAWYREHAGEWD
jgi:dTDP-glucose 4,6-dehydratase